MGTLAQDHSVIFGYSSTNYNSNKMKETVICFKNSVVSFLDLALVQFTHILYLHAVFKGKFSFFPSYLYIFGYVNNSYPPVVFRIRKDLAVRVSPHCESNVLSEEKSCVKM